MSNPHGITAMPDFNTFFITRQEGNIVYKLNRTTGTIKTISIDNLPPSNLPSRDPHEIMMTPDYSKYFLTCERSGEIRIMDAISDTLIKAIAVGKKPQEIALSKQTKQMLITCMEDDSPNPGSKGSVYLINYETFETRRLDGAFYQPHGIAADDSKGQFYVLSRNYTSNGPAPHHPSNCGGRNGFYQIFDLLTLEKRPGTFEVPNDPYSADVRFK
ncbi:MAG: hypothetical protein EOP49_39120 [Sphingobacteriales bacterium]|nr:MAG: hypothetical protein EOP49_39120 [Sphingobacteriales bacterium]